MKEAFFVYMISSRNRRALYIGITNSLKVRVWQHQQQSGLGFAVQYHCVDLVYYEVFATANAAIAREKQLKGWRREKKDRLVELFEEVPSQDSPSKLDEIS